jgi:hypothetical protein
MSPEAGRPRRSTTARIATILTEVFAPAVLAALMPLVIALHTARGRAIGLGWGLLAAAFFSVIPYGVVLLGVRRGHLTDHHIGVREQRRKPLVLGLCSVGIGLALLFALDAPGELLAMALVMLGVVLIVAAVNHWWKLSAHAAVITGSATVLVVVFGAPLLAAFLVVAAVCWSRVELGDHTAAQVIAGAAGGGLIAAVAFPLLA